MCHQPIDNGGGDNEGTGNKGDVILLPSMDRATDGVGDEENEEAGSGTRGVENAGSSVVGDCELTGETPVCCCDVSGVIGHGTTSIGGA